MAQITKIDAFRNHDVVWHTVILLFIYPVFTTDYISLRSLLKCLLKHAFSYSIAYAVYNAVLPALQAFQKV